MTEDQLCSLNTILVFLFLINLFAYGSHFFKVLFYEDRSSPTWKYVVLFSLSITLFSLVVFVYALDIGFKSSSIAHALMSLGVIMFLIKINYFD